MSRLIILKNHFKRKLLNLAKRILVKKDEYVFRTSNFLRDTKIQLKKLFDWSLTVDVDFFFVFLASFILTQQYSLLERLLFSVGLSYVWKYLIIRYAKQIAMIISKR